jgi:hypothetical protein
MVFIISVDRRNINYWYRLAPECFHLPHFPGLLRTGYSPVLTVTSDQASMMFAAANFLAYSCRLRMVWFPDINHIESNAEKAVFVAAAVQQINEKVSFLSRLPYGPRKDAGHWHSQMKQAFEAPAFLFAAIISQFEPKRISDIFFGRITLCFSQ